MGSSEWSGNGPPSRSRSWIGGQRRSNKTIADCREIRRGVRGGAGCQVRIEAHDADLTPVLGAAEHDDDVLVGFRLVADGEDRGERGRAAWLDHETKPCCTASPAPARSPRRRRAGRDRHAAARSETSALLRAGAPASRRQCCRPVHRPASPLSRASVSVGAPAGSTPINPLWLIREPGRDAADKAAAANGEAAGVAASGTCSTDFALRACPGRAASRSDRRHGSAARVIAPTQRSDLRRGRQHSDRRQRRRRRRMRGWEAIFAGEATVGTKIFPGMPRLLRRERHRDAMVSTLGSDHTGRWNGPGQQIVEGAARLERTGVLHELQLEGERKRRQADLGAIHSQHRRAPHMRGDDVVSARDVVSTKSWSIDHGLILARPTRDLMRDGCGQRPETATGSPALPDLYFRIWVAGF